MAVTVGVMIDQVPARQEFSVLPVGKGEIAPGPLELVEQSAVFLDEAEHFLLQPICGDFRLI